MLQLLLASILLLLSVSNYGKLDLFEFGTADQTKQAIWRSHFELYETAVTRFQNN